MMLFVCVKEFDPQITQLCMVAVQQRYLVQLLMLQMGTLELSRTYALLIYLHQILIMMNGDPLLNGFYLTSEKGTGSQVEGGGCHF